jgi:hypothetical protein
MEFTPSNLQSRFANWTVARALAWIARLAVFVLVPGLHQMARQRYVLGSLLLAYFLIGKFLGSSMPVEPGINYIQFKFWYSQDNWNAAQLYACLLLFSDLPNLKQRKLNWRFLIPLPVAVLLYFLPFHQRYLPDYFIEPYGYECPAFCKNDIVMYGRREFVDDKLPQNEPIVLHNYRKRELYVSKPVAGPADEACFSDDLMELQLKSSDPYCKDAYLPMFEDYLVKGPAVDVVDLHGEGYSMIGRNHYFGRNPKRVGSTHKYFVISNEVSGAVGRVLLTIYAWTGLDFLGLSEEFR